MIKVLWTAVADACCGMKGTDFKAWLAALSVFVAVPGSALADTVIFDVSETTTVFRPTFDLPGPGTYLVSVVADRSIVVSMEFERRKDVDIYLAPPPHPHSDSLDGFDADLSTFNNGFAANLEFYWTVPEIARNFYTLTNPLRGLPAGTEVYQETQYLEPRLNVIGYVPLPGYPPTQAPLDPSQTFTYHLLITRLEAAPVPEPATWALMILGFGGVGAAMRRLRRRSETLAYPAKLGCV